MDSRTGKKIRLGRIFRQPTGRSVSIAYSHGSLLGPIPGAETVDDLHAMMTVFSEADAVMLSPGLLPALEGYFVGKGAPALILQADWQNVGRATRGAFGPDTPGASTSMMTVEQALAAGADAIMSYLWLGGDDPDREREEVARNCALVRAGEQLGLPVMIESRGYGSERTADGAMDVDLLRLHTRIAAELGADFVKTKFSGDTESFAQVVRSCPVPILVAGGSRTQPLDYAVGMARDAVAAGAAGVVFGRNIFQADDPAEALTRIAAEVHVESSAAVDNSR